MFINYNNMDSYKNTEIAYIMNKKHHNAAISPDFTSLKIKLKNNINNVPMSGHLLLFLP